MAQGFIVKVPKEYQGKVRRMAQKYGLPPNILALVLQGESGWDKGAVGDNGTSYGLAQIHLPAHPNVSQKQAMNPDFAIEWTARRLGYVYTRTKGNVLATIAYHNCPVCGEHIAESGEWGPTETLATAAKNYVGHVLRPLGGLAGASRLAGTVEVPEADLEEGTPDGAVDGADGEAPEEEEIDPVDEFLNAAGLVMGDEGNDLEVGGVL